MNSRKFREAHDELFIIPAKRNQDFVESFFSTQRQTCGGTQNMNAYVQCWAKVLDHPFPGFFQKRLI